MTEWRPTAALVRATATGALVALAALALGRPDLLVLATPFAVLGLVGLRQAPHRAVHPEVRLADRWLHEGQSTRLVVRVEEAQGLDHVTLTHSAPAYVAVQPPQGVLTATPHPGQPTELTLVVSPRRWGQRSTGSLRLTATSSWGGFRWGPHPLGEQVLVALPETTPFVSAETPHPVGLVGQNRSNRAGAGTEFFSIRPFQPGDRLRRIDWRTTLRTGRVHAVGWSAQQSSSVLILLDATSDVGASGGLDGESSTLDVAVRAASALAAHHLRVGDRVGLRVLGRRPHVLGPGSGLHHQRRLQEMLALVERGWPDLVSARRLRLRVDAGTVVLVLSPVLTPEVTTLMVNLVRQGLVVVVVDTLASTARPANAADRSSAAHLAWRMRLVERRIQITEVSRLGIPVVDWRGPGTLDEVLRQLARRARVPREVFR